MKVSLVLVLILLLAMAACPFLSFPLERLVHGSPQDTSVSAAEDGGYAALAGADTDGK